MHARRHLHLRRSDPALNRKRSQKPVQNRKGMFRYDIIVASFKSGGQSRLFHFLLTILITVFLIFVLKFSLFLGVLPLLFGFDYKRIVFDLFLCLHVIEETLNLWNWFSLVDDDLYLG